MKRCYKCREIKEITAFYRSKKTKDGLRTECKECCKANANAWARNNPGRAVAKAALWTSENKERVVRNQSAYSLQNAEKKRLYAKAWRERNLGLATRNVAEWQARNKGKVRQIKRAHDHKRRAWILGAGGSHSHPEINDLFRKQRMRCAICKVSIKDGYHVDHVKALRNGGSNDIYNIQLLCRSCNCKKNARDPIEFMQSRGFLL